ncbi:MAG: hypothetical protein JXB32_04975 [Deltaproteobacteria bacterium]|nr:hypothetical protein [Deltaproteobacteria bacterium]
MTRRLTVVLGVAAVALSSACIPNFIDIFGVDSIVTESTSNENEPEDDRIEDKHPEYDPGRLVVETFDDGCRFSLNKSATVTKLDIAPLQGDDQALGELVFGTRSAAFAHLEGRTDGRNRLIPSMEVVNGALKPFNDGLYAAVELGAQAGVTVDTAEVYPGKQVFLADLLAGVLALEATATPTQAVHLQAAAADLGAALLLGGATPTLPADLRSRAEALAEQFRGEALLSRPIGFYTWRTELEGIFRQDRFLQNYQVQHPIPLDPYSDAELGKAAAVALALQADAELLERYEGYLALYARLTNPFANLPVTSLLPYLTGLADLDNPGALAAPLLADHPPPALPYGCQPHLAVFPSSRSRETSYFDEQYCESGVPSDVNLMDELIDAIRDGLIELEPDPDSGWYDYQTYALETLLLPERGGESQHLLLTAAYKKKLMDTFRSIMTQNRETHVKQLEMGGSATAMPPTESDIYPVFPVEPFPTFYLRTARAYRFLGTYLGAVLGPEFLGNVSRQVEDGTTGAQRLDAELRSKAALLYGLHFLAADAVGMAAELLAEELAEFPEADCRAAAEAWLVGWRTDADVVRDPRVIVPVQLDPATNDMVYWTVPGVRVVKARAEFVEGYEPKDVMSAGDTYCEVAEIVPMEYYLVIESFAEVRIPYTTPPPTRDEFRAICDAHDTVEEIVAALEAL